MSHGDKGKQVEEEQRGTPAWMVTFSDLATLLLTFFVLLLSMSSMDDRTLKSMFSNFTSASGILYFKEYGEIYRPKMVLIEGLYESLKDVLVVKRSDDVDDDQVSQDDNEFLEKLGGLVIENFKGGFKLVFGHKLLFEPGSAEINKTMFPVLQKVAKFMKSSAYQVYIDGHTDNVPIRGGKYPSNLELSLARSSNLMHYFVITEKISPDSIAIGGYGPHLPVAGNDTAEGRAKNRRVEIIFKNQKYF